VSRRAHSPLNLISQPGRTRQATQRTAKTVPKKDERDIHGGIIGHCVGRGEGIRARDGSHVMAAYMTRGEAAGRTSPGLQYSDCRAPDGSPQTGVPRRRPFTTARPPPARRNRESLLSEHQARPSTGPVTMAKFSTENVSELGAGPLERQR
jgi:hypothetical protein